MRTLVVFPKLECYKNKQTSEQNALFEEVSKLIDKVKDNSNLYVLREDFTALEFMCKKDYEMNVISVISSASEYFIKTNVIDLNPLFNKVQLEALSWLPAIARDSTKAYKMPKLVDCLDELEYLGRGVRCVNNRIRHAANEVMKKFDCIIYVDDTQTYCTKPVMNEIGNGKLIIYLDNRKHVPQVTYGGLPIPITVVEKVLEASK